jgi:AcrR family transcriptional regulator
MGVVAMRAKAIKGFKKWGNIVWNAPGVRNAILAAAIKLLVRVGLSAGTATLLMAVAEALAGGF